MSDPENSVESFTVDHNLMVAPFIRVAGHSDITGGGRLTKYDIRFTQPNVEHLEWAVIHSIEHSLATALRQITTGVIDISPFGCHTGFYAVTDANIITTREQFYETLKQAMNLMLSYSETPASNPTQCGWAEAHDIEGAKRAVREFLKHPETKIMSVFK